MVFSLATVNYDDHLKNFSFLMDNNGAWRLSPAYDVAFAENDAWASQHQLSVAGKFRGITRTDCLRVSKAFDMRDLQANHIIDEVLEAVGLWDAEAKAVDLDKPLVATDSPLRRTVLHVGCLSPLTEKTRDPELRFRSLPRTPVVNRGMQPDRHPAAICQHDGPR